MIAVQTRGIVLHALSFKERDTIFTFFTEQCGIVRAIAKGIRSARSRLPPLAPPHEAELILERRKGDLYTVKDATIIVHHLPLRGDLQRLNGACELLNATRWGQCDENPAPLLFVLLHHYLECLHRCPQPEGIVISYHLKLLHLEGLLSKDDLYERFDSATAELLCFLTASRSSQLIGEAALSIDVCQGVLDLFWKKIERIAKGGTRTPTGFLPLPPQGSASTDSATSAYHLDVNSNPRGS